ncbi:hypothetical protein B1J92_A02695g [Nakaseomyces glabratus]|nr:hypothetical protein B1J91_A02695g [Nakaseomyces glabratus]OXB50676.1 hypothetical protein B1J92_A02695g [Nakaseomyces glabratus]
MDKKRGRGRPRKHAVDETASESIAVAALKSMEGADANASTAKGKGTAKDGAGRKLRRRGRPRKVVEAAAVAPIDDAAAAGAAAVDDAVIDAKLKDDDGDEEYVHQEDDGDDADDADDGDDGDDYVDGDDAIDVEFQPRAKKQKKVRILSKKRGIASTLLQKGRIIRTLKDLSSARDKIERIYGLDRAKLLKLAMVKECFENDLFNVRQETIEPTSPFWFESKHSSELPNAGRDLQDDIAHIWASMDAHPAQFGAVSEKEYNALFKVRAEPIDCQIGETGISLSAGQKAELPVLPTYQRYGLVYNAGAFVTDMAWHTTKRGDEQVQYLVLALSQYGQEPDDKHLRMFGKEEHIACLQVFRFDPHTLSLEKIHDILHPYGEVWDLKWHEALDQTEDTIGALFFACQEGTVRSLNIPTTASEEPVLCQATNIALGVKGNCVTTFDFVSVSRVICGFQNGYVAEFDLCDTQALQRPSYYLQVCSTYISTIVTAHSEFEASTIGAVSLDGYFYIFDPASIHTSKVKTSRYRGGNQFPIVYMPKLYSFFCTDGANIVRAVPPRASFAQHSMGSMPTTVTALSASTLHPMLLSGLSSGGLYITNAVRRLLTGVKNVASVGRTLRLWKWDYNPSADQYRLDPNYEVEKAGGGEISTIELDAPQVAITATKWNESTECGRFYSFSISAGIVTIERIGEK